MSAPHFLSQCEADIFPQNVAMENQTTSYQNTERNMQDKSDSFMR